MPVPGEGRRTFAIRAGALGDTIVALPALAALRRVSSRLEVVGTAPYVHLVPADATHSFDRALFRALYEEAADDTELRELVGHFDLVVAWSKAPLLESKVDGTELIQANPLPPAGVHASEHLMRVLAPLGICGPAPSPSIEVTHAAAGFPETFVALHPGSGSPTKNWAPERFEGVARRARGAGFDVVWIEGEADAELVRVLSQRVPGTVARQLPLGELAAVLARAHLVVGNDSGVSHLAAAVGAPTVAVFVATDPVQWAPRGPRARVAPAGASPEGLWGIACELMDRR